MGKVLTVILYFPFGIRESHVPISWVQPSNLIHTLQNTSVTLFELLYSQGFKDDFLSDYFHCLNIFTIRWDNRVERTYKGGTVLSTWLLRYPSNYIHPYTVPLRAKSPNAATANLQVNLWRPNPHFLCTQAQLIASEEQSLRLSSPFDKNFGFDFTKSLVTANGCYLSNSGALDPPDDTSLRGRDNFTDYAWTM